MLCFSGANANEAWLQAVLVFSEPGLARRQPSRAGDTLELLHTAFEIADPCQRWVASRIPAINPAFALAEVVWILSGSRDSEFVNAWNPALSRYCGGGPTYHGAYGYRLKRHLGFDQLDRACEALAADPDTRQVVLQIWDSVVDLPGEDGRPVDPDVPCNVVSMLKVRDGRLEWMQVMRSNDLFLGVPHNFVQFTSLQEVMSGWLGVSPGAYTHIADSLQVYVHNKPEIDQVERRVAPVNTDRLDLPKTEFDRVFDESHRRARGMIVAQTAGELHDLTHPGAFHRAYANFLLVMGADIARRREWLDLAFELRAECSNPALAAALDRWFVRTIAEYSERVTGPATVI
jgi:thymidylate synthase